MKLPSLEQAIEMFYKGLEAFAEEIEELIEMLIDKIRRIFG